MIVENCLYNNVNYIKSYIKNNIVDNGKITVIQSEDSLNYKFIKSGEYEQYSIPKNYKIFIV